ncbi:MAG TPA: class I SAM-dependent methyltransferase [Terriglobales bacterium]|nr:class I SAM-dependent methyltransferase [Terriglobales bacterium]
MSRREMLDAVAARLYVSGYDAVMSGFAPYERLVDEITGCIDADARGPAHVLDVACGTGTLARRLADRGHQVTGLDVAAPLVEAAERRMDPAHAGRVRFALADIVRDGAPAAGSYDAVVAVHTLSWHAQPRELVRACANVVRPGGTVLIVAQQRPADVGPVFETVRRAEGARAAAKALRWLAPTAAFEALRTVPRHYVGARGLGELLVQVGLDVRDIRSSFLGVSLVAWARRPELLNDDGAVGVPCGALQHS